MENYRADADKVPAYPVAYEANKDFIAAASKAGDGRYGTMWAGQAVPLSQSLPAGDLIEQLANEITNKIKRLNGMT